MVITRPSTNFLRRPLLRRLVAVLAIVAGAAALSACGTTEGFGKDVKNLGGNIEDGAAGN